MAVKTLRLALSASGNCEMVDITDHVDSLLSDCSIQDGTVTIFVPGSTGGLTTIEYEPGLLRDFPAMFDRLIPKKMTYAHDQTWHDGNGHSHVRASLLGPSLTVPFLEKRMLLGTWQQIVFIDFDVRPRNRRLILQVVGD
ncbi:MAG: secondary thiamine-phosphate synthase enzyme [Candidatus Cloacimonetes bacterium 4572_55]|nr:MAG: secondary thiamine-phosphate synthase enzyme [Candidatus Cloacimonetes bacterium 4572_55]